MIAWAAETAVAVTMLMLLVLALRGPVVRWLGAGWAYALWLLPALRIVMPPLPRLAEDLSPLPVVIWVGDAAAPLPASAGSGQWVPILLALWAGGAAAFLLWQALAYRDLARRIARDASARSAFGDIAVIASGAVDGPLAIGFTHRRIVVPTDFDQRYSPAERALALRHELVHHRRGDLWWNFAALVVLALNWFNPLAFLAFRAFRADQELACDATVAAGAPSQRHDYARALIKSASRPGLIAACPLHHADQLKRRLKMMKTHRRSKARTIGGAIVLTALVAGSAAFAGAGQSTPDKQVEREVKREVRIKRVGADGRVEALSEAERAEMRAKCAAEPSSMESDVVVGEGDDKYRTRIMICAKGAPTGQVREKLLAALEEAQIDLDANTEISAERRAAVAAALQAEIERVRAGGEGN